MEVREYEPGDADSAEAARLVHNAVRAADSPWLPQLTSHRWLMTITHGWDGKPERQFLGTVDGTVVAAGSLDFGEWDNRDLSWAGVYVHPEQRRRGYGSAFLEHLMALAREHSARTFGMDGWELPGVEEFASRHGLPVANYGWHRLQHLPEIPAGMVDQLYDEALQHSAGYELLRLCAPSPDELLPALSELTAAINDAPIGDLELEDEQFPVERIQRYEHAQLASGHRLYRVVARERSSGRLAGHTIVAVDAESPWLGEQQDTSVLREDRGHRLGLLLKAEMLRWLGDAEPQLEQIGTWNDEENDHMIEVNERLGYRRTSRQLEFQRRL